jgi:hypothetical protein
MKMRRSKYIIGIRKDMAASLMLDEKEALVEWVSGGNSPLKNPWHMCYEDNRPFSFITAVQFINETASETGSVFFDYTAYGSNDSELNIPF